MFKSGVLNEILETELKQGNLVTQKSNWPPSLDLVICLKYRFDRDYSRSGLRHRVLNDPHYWYAEIHSSATQEMLVCGFKKKS